LIQTFTGGDYRFGLSNVYLGPGGDQVLTTVNIGGITQPYGPLNVDEDIARLWDVESGKTIHSFNQYGPVVVAAISSDGNTIATGSALTYTYPPEGVFDFITVEGIQPLGR
jgi:WD40 repeat protein